MTVSKCLAWRCEAWVHITHGGNWFHLQWRHRSTFSVLAAVSAQVRNSNRDQVLGPQQLATAAPNS